MKKIVGFCFKIFVLFVFVFLLCFFVYIKSFELSPKLKIVSKSVLNVSKKIETKYQATFNGIGWGSDINELINLISVTYTFNQKKTKEEIREMLIEINLLLLRELNENNQLKSYLVNKKLNSSNINIGFFIHNEKNDFLYDPDIGMATLSYGKITYETYVPYNKYLKTASKFSETYEEALKKIQNPTIP